MSDNQVNNKGVWIYDIETFQNFFSCIFYNVDTLERKDFIVCKWRDELSSFISFTSNLEQVKGLVGLLRLTLN